MNIRVLDILKGTTVDGPGFRTSIYVAGCRHQCPGCHNPESWDFCAGHEMSIDEIMQVVNEEDFDVTLSGGDPMYHPQEIHELARRVHASGHTVWLFTGFVWEDIVNSPELAYILEEIDVIVDGPYIASRRNTDLQFRGSDNQRIIDVGKSLASGHAVLWQRPNLPYL